MSEKHTPGPWKYREETAPGVFIHSYSIERSADPETVWDDHAYTIAHLTTGVGGEAESNARLIAAAPEMLECLKQAEASARVQAATLRLEGHEEHAKERERWADTFAAVIARAEGRAS